MRVATLTLSALNLWDKWRAEALLKLIQIYAGIGWLGAVILRDRCKAGSCLLSAMIKGGVEKLFIFPDLREAKSNGLILR